MLFCSQSGRLRQCATALPLLVLAACVAQNTDSGALATPGRSPGVVASPSVPAPDARREGVVPLFRSDPYEFDELGVPLAFGFPFGAEENVQDLAQYVIFDGDQARPTELEVLSRWDTPAKPIRWALVRTLIDLGGSGAETLGLARADTKAPAVPSPLEVQETKAAYVVRTGEFLVEPSRKEGTIFRRIELGSKRIVEAKDNPQAGIVLVLPNGDTYRSRAHRAPNVRLEKSSPLYARFRITLDLVSDRGATLRPKEVRTVCSLEFHAGRSEVRLRVELQNDRAMHDRSGHFDPSSVLVFDRLSLGLALAAPVETVRTEGFYEKGKELRVLQRHEVKAPTDESQNFEYQLQAAGRVLETGKRHPGWLGFSGADYSVHAAVRWFWQNYEKGLLVKPGLLEFELWPSEGSYPRGDEGYRFAGGRRKAHDLFIAFDSQPEADPKTKTARFLDPVMVRAAPERYANTYALGPTDDGRSPFSADDPRAWRAYHRYNETLRAFVGVTRPPAHPRQRIHDIFEAKEIRGVVGGDYDLADWYGWPHFGDAAWDTGEYSSNHYDMPGSMALHFLRLGDRAFWDYAEPHMRFAAEFGQYWADDPDNGYPSLSFYEKTRHGAEKGPPTTYHLPSHNWLKRLVLLHWLTGDPFAREAAERNGRGLVRYFYEMWFSIKKPETLEYPKGWSVLTEPRFVTWTLENFLDLYALTGDPEWMSRSEDLVRAILYIFGKSGHINGGFDPKGGGALMTHYATEPLVRFHLESKNEPLRAEVLKMLEGVVLDTYGARGIRGAKGREVAFATGSGSDYRPACTLLSWDGGQGEACFGIFNGFVASLYGYVGDQLLRSKEPAAEQRGRRYLVHARELWIDGWLYPAYQSPGTEVEERATRDEDGFDYWYWINGFPNAAEKVNARLARMGLPYLYVLHRRALSSKP